MSLYPRLPKLLAPQPFRILARRMRRAKLRLYLPRLMIRKKAEQMNPDEYLPVVSWVDQEHGVWKIHNTTLLAKLWGEFTGNKQMTYATLAHSLRLYYGKILERTARNQRLQHRFKAGFLESKNKRAQGLFLPLSRPLPLLSDPKRQYTPL
ncbi:ETS-related transcription factor Elf-1-like protein [Aphelenchoides fujianensis]|nr:ETS-related transcription factor Elf-1-like protein [Aphelenchoides fujianensis]